MESTEDTKLQFFRYFFVGGFCSIINIGLLYGCTELLHLHYLISNSIGFIGGVFSNYLLSKIWIFHTKKSINKIIEFIIYAMIGMVGLGIDTCFMWLFTSVCKTYYMFSKILSTAIVFIWNFTGRKILYALLEKKC